MRATSKLARVAIASAAAVGITPSSASTVLAADSTWSQQRYLFSSVQILPIAGSVYRSIKRGSPKSAATPYCSGSAGKKEGSLEPCIDAKELIEFIIENAKPRLI